MVLGGASGIGAAVVARHRAAGTEVVVWDLDDGADIQCDITDPDAVASAVDLTGVPDTVTITAGIGHGGMLLDAAPGDWDRVMGVNAKGVWLVMRRLVRRIPGTSR